MVIYLSYLEVGCVPCNTFYGLVRTNACTTQGIFNTIMDELKIINLDMSRLIAFGLDGYVTMVGRKKGVATHEKGKSYANRHTLCSSLHKFGHIQ